MEEILASNESRPRLKLSGALTIENAATVAASLQAAIKPGADIEVDLSAVTELDLPALQLLYSAAKTVQATGNAMKLTGKLQSDAIRRLVASGFIREIPGTAEQLMRQLPDYPGNDLAQ